MSAFNERFPKPEDGKILSLDTWYAKREGALWALKWADNHSRTRIEMEISELEKEK